MLRFYHPGSDEHGPGQRPGGGWGASKNGWGHMRVKRGLSFSLAAAVGLSVQKSVFIAPVEAIFQQSRQMRPNTSPEKTSFFFSPQGPSNNRTNMRTRTNTTPYGTEASAAG